MTNPTPIQKPNLTLTQRLTAAGFTVPTGESIPRIVGCSEAREKAGKTEFAIGGTLDNSGLPDPLAVISVDTGTKDIVDRAVRKGRRITMLQIKAPKELGKSDAEAEWEKCREAIYAVLETPTIRSLVIDTASELWELLRMAEFGKLTQVKSHHYGPVNDKMRNLVKRCFDRPELNSWWIHKVKKQYKGGDSGDTGNWTGQYERAGFADLGFLADVCITQYKSIAKVDANGDPDIRGEYEQKIFGLRVIDSRFEQDKIGGMVLESKFGQGANPDTNTCDFVTLATSCWPGTNAAYWR